MKNLTLETLQQAMQLPENREAIEDMQLIEKILIRQLEADRIRLHSLGVRWE